MLTSSEGTRTLASCHILTIIYVVPCLELDYELWYELVFFKKKTLLSRHERVKKCIYFLWDLSKINLWKSSKNFNLVSLVKYFQRSCHDHQGHIIQIFKEFIKINLSLKKSYLSHPSRSLIKILPSRHTTSFWRAYNVIWPLWTLDGRQSNVLCLLGIRSLWLKDWQQYINSLSHPGKKFPDTPHKSFEFLW